MHILTNDHLGDGRWAVAVGDGPMRTVVILTALDLEYQAVRQHPNGLHPQFHEAGTLFETGYLPDSDLRVAIAVTGAGNSGAAVLAERAIRMLHPCALLFVGVAGALAPDIDLGDIVVATKVYALHGGSDAVDGFLPRPRAWEAPHELEQLARHVARDRTWHRLLQPQSTQPPPQIHFKPIIAGEVVLNSRDGSTARQIRAAYSDAAAIEMESAGSAHASHLNRSLPTLSVRGISDKADGEKYNHDGAGWQAIAAGHAAAFAIAVSEQILLAAHQSPQESRSAHGDVPRRSRYLSGWRSIALVATCSVALVVSLAAFWLRDSADLPSFSIRLVAQYQCGTDESLPGADLDGHQAYSHNFEGGARVDFIYGHKCSEDRRGLHKERGVYMGEAPSGDPDVTRCKDAAVGGTVDNPYPPENITRGRSLCVTTTEGAIAWMTVTNVEGIPTNEFLPAITFEVILWPRVHSRGDGAQTAVGVGSHGLPVRAVWMASMALRRGFGW